jgi:glycosyltransferase involved in cell wall biosynthesis
MAVLYAGFGGALAGAPRRVALVAGLGNVLKGGGLPSRALQPFYRTALASHHGIMVQNTDDEQRMRELLGPRTALLKLPGSGVDLAQFSPPPSPPAGRPLVMMVTRLVWAKGLREFCAVASRLRDAADFALVGSLDSNPDSPTRAQIGALAAQHGVELKLDVEDVAAELRRAHAFAYPSYYPEGIPRSLIEALAVGVPVVTTLSPGCREAIEDGKEGFLVPPKDVGALERGLRTLLADPELRGAFRLRARARAERVFDERAVASSMAEFLLPG